MRHMLTVTFPNKRFNDLVKKGKAGPAIRKILDHMKPEAVYFSDHNGRRSACIIVDVKEPKDIPVLTEPWFLQFNADIEWKIAMSPKDLAKSGIDKMGKKWS